MLATALAGACQAETTRPGVAGDVPDDGGWSAGAPRDEIRPEFAREPGDGPAGATAWTASGRRPSP